MLRDPLDLWPAAWRAVLKRLELEQARPTPARAREGTALRGIQEQALSGTIQPVRPDESVRRVHARSVQIACEAVAVALAADGARLSETVVLCASDTAAICLDDCLARLGLPTMGARLPTLSVPGLQVLPLALRLCWKPVPARPLQEPGLRPAGAEIVIQEPSGKEGRAGADPCRFCDFKPLCGVEQLA